MDTNTKIKDWFKKNWITIVLVIIVAGGIFLAFRQFSLTSTYEDLLNKKYTEQSESFKKQINEINKINDERFKQQEALLKAYDVKIQLIDQQYKTSLAEIAAKQRRLQTQIVVDAQKDPTTLTSKVKDTFGIPVKDEVSQ